MKAIQAVTAAGYSVKHVFCVLEREENNALKIATIVILYYIGTRISNHTLTQK
jgi:orotate phosphoribosyltransferase